LYRSAGNDARGTRRIAHQFSLALDTGGNRGKGAWSAAIREQVLTRRREVFAFVSPNPGTSFVGFAYNSTKSAMWGTGQMGIRFVLAGPATAPFEWEGRR
jgi:hypothetical protein